MTTTFSEDAAAELAALPCRRGQFIVVFYVAALKQYLEAFPAPSVEHAASQGLPYVDGGQMHVVPEHYKAFAETEGLGVAGLAAALVVVGAPRRAGAHCPTCSVRDHCREAALLEAVAAGRGSSPREPWRN